MWLEYHHVWCPQPCRRSLILLWICMQWWIQWVSQLGPNVTPIWHHPWWEGRLLWPWLPRRCCFAALFSCLPFMVYTDQLQLCHLVSSHTLQIPSDGLSPAMLSRACDSVVCWGWLLLAAQQLCRSFPNSASKDIVLIACNQLGKRGLWREKREEGPMEGKEGFILWNSANKDIFKHCCKWGPFLHPLLLLESCFFFFFLVAPLASGSSWPEDGTHPQQLPKLLQWQCWVLNLLSHKRTPPESWF